MNIQKHRIAAIILAAGSGNRIAELGPKPLLKNTGKAFIEISYSHSKRVGCSPIVIVTNHKLFSKLAVFQFDAQMIINPVPEQGMLSSIWCGLAALPKNVSGFFLVPIDFPLVKLSTFERMKYIHHIYPEAIIRPEYNHKTGHPVIFPVHLFDELKRASLDGGARSIVRKYHYLCKDVRINDPGILININTIDLYEKYCK